MNGPRDADRPIRTALYAGSFDPLTNGHLDVIRAAVRLCDILIVAVGTHATKQPLLDQATRTALILSEAAPAAEALGCRLLVETFSGLAVDAARLFGATVIVRGLRGSADFDDEIAMAGMNAAMAPEVQTIFIAGFARHAVHHGDSRAPDRHHERRCLALRSREGRGGAQGRSGRE